MVTRYDASPYSGMASQPFTLPTAEQAYGAKQYVRRAVITLASQAAADVSRLCILPKGSVPMGGQLFTDTSLGSTTVAIGNATSSGKYRTAATFTATNTPTEFGNVAGLGITPLTADEEVLLTYAAATAPAAGTLIVDMYYAQV